MIINHPSIFISVKKYFMHFDYIFGLFFQANLCFSISSLPKFQKLLAFTRRTLLQSQKQNQSRF